MVSEIPTCLDGSGPPVRHSWTNTGLDSEDGQPLVHTARCVWCGTTATKPMTSTSGPIRSSVRVKP